ncbi:hypothetical protein J3A83DRAFT_4199450 [Scleroderma citrinum]
MQSAAHRRSSTYNAPPTKQLRIPVNDLFSDSRWHGNYQGPVRNVRLPRATTVGGGMIAKSEDGVRCVVAGRESLRILRLSELEESQTSDHKSAVGRGGHRIEASRNMWEGSGLKIDSASTDVAWCHGAYNHKILTSARNGELIMWDLNQSGNSKYERKMKDHVRSVHKVSCSSIAPYYCVTGSADGDMRVWDLRDMSRSLMKIHHPTSVRSLVFSPCSSHPLQAVVGLDNGSIYRWDLQMGQRGQLDRLPVAHTGAILSLDWCCAAGSTGPSDDGSGPMVKSWIVSGSLDHTVKVWGLSGTSTSSHMLAKPTYTLHPAYPVRRVLWRPDYPCELALVSNAEFGAGYGSELMASPRLQNATTAFIAAASGADIKDKASKPGIVGDTVEIWDVRRSWIAKWTVEASVSEGGVTDIAFRDSHAIWAQHTSGMFAQIDLRTSTRPIDAVPRVAVSWNVGETKEGSLAFITDRRARCEVPYDDVHPEKRSLLLDRKWKPKGLGDISRMPSMQSMGTYVRSFSSENSGLRTFSRLAKQYLIPEDASQRKDSCGLNAEIAMQAGDMRAAQVWLLLKILFTDVIPESLISSLSHAAQKEMRASGLSRSVSAPAPGASPVSYGSGTTPIKGSAHSILSDPALSSHHAHAQFSSPLHSPLHNHPPSSNTYHKHKHQRSISNNSLATSFSNSPINGGRMPASKHPPPLELPHPTKAPPNSRTHTPVSSATSSPRHYPAPLPSGPPYTHPPPTPTTPMPPAPLSTIKVAPSPTLTMTPRRPFVLGPAPPPLTHSHAHAHLHTRRYSIFGRSSAVPSVHSESPSGTSAGSLRHVGEGALSDDSDSSDAASEGERDLAVRAGAGTSTGAGSERNRSPNAGEHMPAPGEISPPLPHPSSAMARSLSLSRASAGPIHPSPLSRIAVQQMWSDATVDTARTQVHTDSDDSPSPGSTDSESAPCGSGDECSVKHHYASRARTGSMVKIRPRKVSRARHSNTRSRSSTVASLAAPLLPPSPAVSSSVGSGISTPVSPRLEPQPNQMREGSLVRRESQSSAQTVIANSLREADHEAGTSLMDTGASDISLIVESCSEMSNQQKLVMVDEEAQLRNAAWKALRDSLEVFADEGDVQMCAMLVLFAADELKIDLVRALRFIESYIDMLMRHRLHTPAAYIRKRVPAEDIRKTTGLETTIYTACGRCRKPIMATRTRSPVARRGYTICSSCRAPVVRCAICHLPVRALLFQCSVCTHGGHQECYRRYYMERPMDMLTPAVGLRGRQLHRVQNSTNGDAPLGNVSTGSTGERSLASHPCAAGCGHLCWMALMDRKHEGNVQEPMKG